VKRQRQRALLQLLSREPLGSQEDIRRRLAELGHPATQSTISRDLDELGLVRVHEAPGRYRYVSPRGDEGRAGVPLQELLEEFAVGVDLAGNLLLVKTHPGAANAVAGGLDRSGIEGILGTVAGDDTIIAVVRPGAAGRRIARRLRELAAL
jgi:transcriptional regulator of arginine metabolism